MKLNIDFVKLTKEELSSKIALLVSKRSRVIFWKSSPKFYEGNAFHVDVRNKLILTIADTDVLVKLKNEKICLNFIIEDIDYFFSGNVIEHDDESKIIRLELAHECFRLEKRSRDRLQTYPKYEVFAYLKYFIDAPKNVIQFNKSEQKNKDFLTKLNDSRLSQMVAMSEEMLADEEEDIVGFRVENLSPNGLSFFASVGEKENVLAKFQNIDFKLTLNFNMQAFTLDEAKIVYVMDYINPQFSGVTMFKVGIEFKYSPSLKRRIEDLGGISVDIIDYQREFEEFIRNE